MQYFQEITVPVAQTANTWEDTNAVRTIGTTTTNNDVTGRTEMPRCVDEVGHCTILLIPLFYLSNVVRFHFEAFEGGHTSEIVLLLV